MTERDDERIDLTTLGSPDPEQADRVVRAAMARIQAMAPAPEPLLADLDAWWRPGLAAAAAIALLALGMMLARQRPGPEAVLRASVEARVLEWAESEHIPSNGELVAAFQGYSR